MLSVNLAMISNFPCRHWDTAIIKIFEECHSYTLGVLSTCEVLGGINWVLSL